MRGLRTSSRRFGSGGNCDGGCKDGFGHSSILTKRAAILEAMITTTHMHMLSGLQLVRHTRLSFLLMALQSACIPIPSEVIMPFAGYKLGHSLLDLCILATVASLASNLGSIPAYFLGARAVDR